MLTPFWLSVFVEYNLDPYIGGWRERSGWRKIYRWRVHFPIDTDIQATHMPFVHVFLYLEWTVSLDPANINTY